MSRVTRSIHRVFFWNAGREREGVVYEECDRVGLADAVYESMRSQLIKDRITES